MGGHNVTCRYPYKRSCRQDNHMQAKSMGKLTVVVNHVTTVHTIGARKGIVFYLFRWAGSVVQSVRHWQVRSPVEFSLFLLLTSHFFFRLLDG